MNKEEIVLKTEVVKIAGLDDRERQIWEHGKSCGYAEAEGEKYGFYQQITGIVLIGLIGVLLLIFIDKF